jgi:hypothetical protein
MEKKTMPTQLVLKIDWPFSGTTEFVPTVNAPGHAREPLRTLERWKGGTRVYYTARLVEFSRKGRRNILRLRYKPADQRDPTVLANRDDILWGDSTIAWDVGGSSGRAAWKSYKGSLQIDDVPVTIWGEQSPVTGSRTSISVLVKARPKQAELRDVLLEIDRSCALTGESEARVLQAAHIVPVKADGREEITNALLLRADLHLLFDAGLIWFDVSRGPATVRHSKSLTRHYKELLAGRTLSEQLAARIRRALEERAKRPGGQGVDA